MLIIILTTLIITFFALARLFLIDLHTRILPNTYVFALFCCGVVFHITTNFTFSSPASLTLGALAGASLLFGIRAFANRLYKKDTLGLGDVKLLGATGIWLGLEDIFLAISLGALFGVLHGLLYAIHLKHKTGTLPALKNLSIPAGPGFILGFLSVGLWKFQNLPLLFVPMG